MKHLALAALLIPVQSLAGVTVALQGPATVPSGGYIVLDLNVTQSGSAFNGYDATVGWDPSKLTFVAMSPLRLQEGSLMTGACGSTYHYFQAHSTTVDIGHVIWCAGMSLTGPGQLYRLKFQATGSTGSTTVSIVSTQFWNAGNAVGTDSATNAAVEITYSDPGCSPEPCELEKVVPHVGIPVHSPHRENWTDVAPSPWSKVKGLYK